MSRIDEFRSKLIGGGARPTQFQVLLQFPTWVAGNAAANAAPMMVKGTTLPASTITPIDVFFRGRIAKIAGERQFANWNVTILNDGDFVIKTALEAWSKGILAHSETGGRIAPTSYTANLLVHQLDRNDNIVKTYKFYNCFPQVVSEIQLDFGATQNIEEYQVEFSVDYWETTDVSGTTVL